MIPRVGIFIDHATHQRTLLPVAVAATTEHNNETPRRKFAERLEDVEQRVVAYARNRRKLEIAVLPERLRVVPAPVEIATNLESLRAG